MKSKDQILLEQAYVKIYESQDNDIPLDLNDSEAVSKADVEAELSDDLRKENEADSLQDFIEQIASDAADYAENRPYPPDIENFIDQSLNSEKWKDFWDNNRGAYEYAKEEVYKIFSEYNPNFFGSYR